MATINGRGISSAVEDLSVNPKVYIYTKVITEMCFILALSIRDNCVVFFKFAII